MSTPVVPGGCSCASNLGGPVATVVTASHEDGPGHPWLVVFKDLGSAGSVLGDFSVVMGRFQTFAEAEACASECNTCHCGKVH